MQADGLGRADEADRAVQPGVVGDGQPGQPQLDGPLDQVVRGRGPIEEREVGVAVEFGVGVGATGRSGRMAGCLGAGQYRTSVLVSERRPGDDRDEGRVDIPAAGRFLGACDLPDRPSVGSSRSGSGPCSRSACSPRPRCSAASPRPVPPTEIRPRITGIQPLSHEVYGYLPYWRLDSGTVDRINYDLVSTIAFFGLGIKSTGDLDRGWVGYKEYVGDAAAAVTNAAHDKGVRVVPTFQLFDSKAGYPKMTKFLTNPAAQDRFIAQALDLMAAPQGRRRRPRLRAGRRAEPARQVLRPVRRQRSATAMKARFPDATLVNATVGRRSERIIKGLVAARRPRRWS